MKLTQVTSKIDLYYNLSISGNRLIDKKIKHKVSDEIGVFDIIESISNILYGNEIE